MATSSAARSSDHEYRFERKFLVENLTPHEIQALVRLHPALFSPIHSRRFINNIYFDTPDDRALTDGLEGSGKRVKMRIRWYGDLQGKHDATLEFKIKRGLVGRKESIELGRLDVGPGITREALATKMASVAPALPAPLSELLATSRPVLVNRYRRSYYRSGDGRFRLTLDDKLQFFPTVAGRAHLVGPVHDHHSAIVELKYATEHDRDANRITSAFPFRLTKSSKFVSGLQRLTF